MTGLEQSLNEEKILNLMEDLQAENEQYRDHIQKILSEKQELELLVVEQQRRIAEQKEKIEMLNESDKELQRGLQVLKEGKEKILTGQRIAKEAKILKDKAESEIFHARMQSQLIQKR